METNAWLIHVAKSGRMDGRGRRGWIGRGDRGHSAPPPLHPSPPRSPPSVEEQTHIIASEVMNMICSFQQMSHALISRIE